MTYMERYRKWLDSPAVAPQDKEELRSIASDEKEIESRFFDMLGFGTAGLRGILGVGLYRMNLYTVRYATQGLSELIKKCGPDEMKRGVSIAYDCRNMSYEFARAASEVLAANAIKAYMFDELRPTPELSFSVRELNCIAGINITASHNPKQYNGYKVYWEDGAQLPPEHADAVSASIAELDIFDDVKRIPFEEGLEKGLIQIIGEEIDEKYLKNVLAQMMDGESIKKASKDFRIIYTPFHGTGYRLVPKALKTAGMDNIVTVPEQMAIDGNFPTVKSPNPEDKEGFKIAIEMAKAQNIDLIIGTDPDADRVGIVVRDRGGEYVTMTGNQVGVLLLDYIIKTLKKRGEMPRNPFAVKTIVTTEMAQKVCDDNGVELMNVLTGFKFIGEKIKEFHETGKKSYLFGFEESYGYLKGTYARDKDAVVASLLIVEMACSYKLQGIGLYEAMQQLYKEYGYFDEKVISVVIEGTDSLGRMAGMMRGLRGSVPGEIGGIAVKRVRDYKEDYILDLASGERRPTGLPRSDVLFYELADGSSFIIRPSGTEPKIKCYMLVNAADKAGAEKKIDELTCAAKWMLS